MDGPAGRRGQKENSLRKAFRERLYAVFRNVERPEGTTSWSARFQVQFLFTKVLRKRLLAAVIQSASRKMLRRKPVNPTAWKKSFYRLSVARKTLWMLLAYNDSRAVFPDQEP